MQTSCLEAAIAAKPAAWAEPPGSSEGGKFLSQYLDKLAAIMHNAVAGLFSVSRRTSAHRAEVSNPS